jgi:hypothetical protein
MTFDEFNDGWNNLRNAVMGRGTAKPANVSQKLYDRVGNAITRWQRWYPQASLLDQTMFELSATQWLAEYRELSKMALDEGAQVKVLNESALENFGSALSDVLSDAKRVTKDAAKAAGETLQIGGVVLAVGAAVALSLWAMTRK